MSKHTLSSDDEDILKDSQRKKYRRISRNVDEGDDNGEKRIIHNSKKQTETIVTTTTRLVEESTKEIKKVYEAVEIGNKSGKEEMTFVVETKANEVKSEVSDLKKDVKESREEVKSEVISLKRDVKESCEEVKSEVNDLKRDVKENQETARYMTGKHADQAGMLRKLNKDLNEQREENKQLMNENAELRKQLGQNKAYEDCIYMNGEILDEIKELKKLVRTSGSRT